MGRYSKLVQEVLEEEYRERLYLDPLPYEMPPIVDPADKEERERLSEGCYMTQVPDEDDL